MYCLTLSTSIAAPIATCFDLARDVGAHVESAAGTGERVVGGRTSGLLELGEEITWEGRHFGITQRLSSRITELRPYTFFQDRMTKGAFRFFEHDHHFESQGDGTLMTDVLRFQAPFGSIGWLAERMVLGPHLRRFLIARIGAKGDGGTVTATPWLKATDDDQPINAWLDESRKRLRGAR